MSRGFTEVTELTDELKTAAESIVDGWYAEGNVDWTRFLERMEDVILEDGTSPDFGTNMGSAPIEALKRHVRDYRRSG